MFRPPSDEEKMPKNIISKKKKKIKSSGMDRKKYTKLNVTAIKTNTKEPLKGNSTLQLTNKISHTKKMKSSGINKQKYTQLNVSALKTYAKQSSKQLTNKISSTNNQFINLNKKVSVKEKRNDLNNNNNMKQNQIDKMREDYSCNNYWDNIREENLLNHSNNEEPIEKHLLFSDYFENSSNSKNDTNYLIQSQYIFKQLKNGSETIKKQENMSIDLQSLEKEDTTLQFNSTTIDSPQIENSENCVYSPRRIHFYSDDSQYVDLISDLFKNEYLNSSGDEVYLFRLILYIDLY